MESLGLVSIPRGGQRYYRTEVWSAWDHGLQFQWQQRCFQKIKKLSKEAYVAEIKAERRTQTSHSLSFAFLFCTVVERSLFSPSLSANAEPHGHVCTWKLYKISNALSMSMMVIITFVLNLIAYTFYKAYRHWIFPIKANWVNGIYLYIIASQTSDSVAQAKDVRINSPYKKIIKTGTDTSCSSDSASVESAIDLARLTYFQMSTVRVKGESRIDDKSSNASSLGKFLWSSHRDG